MVANQPTKICIRCGKTRNRWSNKYCSQSCAFADGREPHKIAERFWTKVQKSDGCWLWTGGIASSGYGHAGCHGRVTTAHRVAWYLTTGEMPPSHLDVCHKCDVKTCVRPEHLFLGTRRDNVLDMLKKGRGNPAKGDKSSSRLHPESRPRGTKVYAAKLNDEIVRFIRAEHAKGVGVRELGRRLRISHTTVGCVIRGVSWKHVA